MEDMKRKVEAAMIMLFGIAYLLFPDLLPGIIDDAVVLLLTYNGAKKRLEN